jgi:osmotically-inducible protein OsmY
MKMKSDIQLQRDVIDELAWEPSVDAAQIGVSVDSGIVTLNGSVKSFPEKWAAERASQRVSGVKAVSDEITVALPGENKHTDTDIARTAVNSLEWNASVPKSRVKVLVKDGFITLSGKVEFYYQKNEAERAVRNLMGVKGVHNEIEVMPVVWASDVKTKIEKALERAAQVDAQRISVEAHERRVVLRGNVKTWVEREEAERAAWSAPGVADVQNDIRIAA